ncbi:Crp/Fnr family transcriptional regulator [Nubsella zeaxanthinifaciens]|jgi:CRP-like cAMP-binding protein|uniref:Crp/Fnr family transcriptional regulator n=1 Tax=Nubsella zeaxanthinifaciens TaxID=392412 RepID=UPI003D01D49F
MNAVDIKSITDVLSAISSCRTSTKILFGSCFSVHEVKKGELYPPTEERTMNFLAEGMLHEYFEADADLGQPVEGRQPDVKSIRFHHPGQFFPRLPNNGHNTAISNISALTPSLVYQCSYAQIIDCYKSNPEIADLFLYLLDQWTHRINDEIILLHEEPALLRYQKFRAQNDTTNQIPQKFIASYLHISRKHLGRLNRQILKKR